MSKLYLSYLKDILEEIDFLSEQIRTLSKEEFVKDKTLKRAFVRSLEIIGEAVKKLPDELKTKYPQADWRAIAGTRDKLIHNYSGVDYDIVWDIVVSEIPMLKAEIDKIIGRESLK